MMSVRLRAQADRAGKVEEHLRKVMMWLGTSSGAAADFNWLSAEY